MPDENYAITPSAQLMQPDEIDVIAKTFISMGVKKVRLTGGEPLIRKDAAQIIERLSAYPVELSLTTNGTRLHTFLPQIKKAGIRSLNISLDTLDREGSGLI